MLRVEPAFREQAGHGVLQVAERRRREVHRCRLVPPVPLQGAQQERVGHGVGGYDHEEVPQGAERPRHQKAVVGHRSRDPQRGWRRWPGAEPRSARQVRHPDALEPAQSGRARGDLVPLGREPLGSERPCRHRLRRQRSPRPTPRDRGGRPSGRRSAQHTGQLHVRPRDAASAVVEREERTVSAVVRRPRRYHRFPVSVCEPGLHGRGGSLGRRLLLHAAGGRTLRREPDGAGMGREGRCMLAAMRKAGRHAGFREALRPDRQAGRGRRLRRRLLLQGRSRAAAALGDLRPTEPAGSRLGREERPVPRGLRQHRRHLGLHHALRRARQGERWRCL